MTKHKVSADVRALADKYYCEQCDRLGVPRPHPVKPLKTPKPDKPGKPPWVKPRSFADAFGGLSIDDASGFVRASREGGEDTADGLSLEALWRSGHEMFARDDEWAAYREKD